VGTGKINGRSEGEAGTPVAAAARAQAHAITCDCERELVGCGTWAVKLGRGPQQMKLERRA